MLGGPVVSPDGTRLAFIKDEDTKDEDAAGLKFKFTKNVVEQLYSMNIDGSGLRVLLKLSPPPSTISGVYSRLSPLAWSHDNRKILTVNRLTYVSPVDGPSDFRLLLVDVASQEATVVLPLIGRRTMGSGIGGSVITPQAWAPDSRRFVYMNDDGNVVIHDLESGAETSLGRGREPTWSPDGHFIAFQLPGEKGGRREGDHVVVSVDPPHERTRLLSNSRSLFSFRGLGYWGAAVWLPDSRFLTAVYYPGERGFAHVVDRMTGKTAKLPVRYSGPSWGGKQ